MVCELCTMSRQYSYQKIEVQNIILFLQNVCNIYFLTSRKYRLKWFYSISCCSNVKAFYISYIFQMILVWCFFTFSLVKRTHNKRKKMLMNFNIIQRQIFSINSTYIQTQFKHLDIESKLECNTNFEWI